MYQQARLTAAFGIHHHPHVQRQIEQKLSEIHARQRLAAEDEQDGPAPVAGDRGNGVLRAAGLPEQTAIRTDHPVVLHDVAVTAKPRFPFVRGPIQQIGPGQVAGVRPGHEKRAEKGGDASVVDDVPGAQITRTGHTVRQIHAGIDGRDQILAPGPFAKREGHALRRRRFHREIIEHGIDAQDHHLEGIPSLELGREKPELQAFLKRLPRRKPLKRQRGEGGGGSLRHSISSGSAGSASGGAASSPASPPSAQAGAAQKRKRPRSIRRESAPQERRKAKPPLPRRGAWRRNSNKGVMAFWSPSPGREEFTAIGPKAQRGPFVRERSRENVALRDVPT